MTALLPLCTAFLLAGTDGPLVGKCYDWHMGQGLVLVNKRGLAKRAIPLAPTDRPAEWVARHASITFNQYGRELPNAGMNDAGLVVEILWLDASTFAPPDARPTVNELQWIQYQLDTHATVAELIAAAPALRISRVNGRVHYFTCDRSGACAVLEHLDGKLVISSGDALPIKAITNNTYADSLAFFRARAGRPAPTGMASLDRFARAASLTTSSKDPFALLDSVDHSGSKWHIVYDPIHLRVQFRTRAQHDLKSVDLAKFPATCRTPTQMLDIDTPRTGDVTPLFTNYTDDANRRLVEKSLHDLAAQLPPKTLDKVAAYPSLLPCAVP